MKWIMCYSPGIKRKEEVDDGNKMRPTEKKRCGNNARGRKKRKQMQIEKLTTSEGAQHIVRVTCFVLQDLSSQRLLLKDRISIDGLLKPRQSLVNTHLTIFLLAPAFASFRRRKPRRNAKSRTSTIGLGLSHRLTPNQTLEFVEVCAGVHANVHFHKSGLRFEAKVYGACTIAFIVGLTAIAIGILKKIDLLELAWCDENVVFCNDWIVVLNVVCS